MSKDAYYMQIALQQANKAFQVNEVPVGCVIVYQDKIIARSYNKRHTNKNTLDHAEIIAIKKACNKLNAWILDECDIYVTLEPCLMCAGAMLQARIRRLIYATSEPKFGSCGSVINVIEDKTFNHQIQLTTGILEEESKQLLKSFFKQIRAFKLKVGVKNEGNNQESK
jgi:tRNA(adenine34) deaminase